MESSGIKHDHKFPFKISLYRCEKLFIFWHQQKTFITFWSAGKNATAAHVSHFWVSQYIELTLTHINPFIPRHNLIYAIASGRLVCRHSPLKQFTIFPWIRWEFIKFFNPFLNILFNYGNGKEKYTFPKKYKLRVELLNNEMLEWIEIENRTLPWCRTILFFNNKSFRRNNCWKYLH